MRSIRLSISAQTIFNVEKVAENTLIHNMIYVCICVHTISKQNKYDIYSKNVANRSEYSLVKLNILKACCLQLDSIIKFTKLKRAYWVYAHIHTGSHIKIVIERKRRGGGESVPLSRNEKENLLLQNCTHHCMHTPIVMFIWFKWTKYWEIFSSFTLSLSFSQPISSLVHSLSLLHSRSHYLSFSRCLSVHLVYICLFVDL